LLDLEGYLEVPAEARRRSSRPDGLDCIAQVDIERSLLQVGVANVGVGRRRNEHAPPSLLDQPHRR
jgi:hypothetical protein